MAAAAPLAKAELNDNVENVSLQIIDVSSERRT